MTLARHTLLIAVAFSSTAFFLPGPASARTICRPDGYCFNTSGNPIPYYDQPAYQGYYAYHPYHHYYHRRYWRHYED
jgi:hypothetical protein